MHVPPSHGSHYRPPSSVLCNVLQLYSSPRAQRSLADLHSRRLWHQLTDKLEIVVDDAAFFPILIEMYDKCIHEFALKVTGRCAHARGA